MTEHIDRDRLLDKIRALQAKAASAEELGSFEEAKAFAGKVSELLQKYGFSMTEVELRQRIESDGITGKVTFANTSFKRRKVQWECDLALVIAKAHNCQALSTPSTNLITFVGLTHDVDVVLWLYWYLTEAITRECDLQYDRKMKALRREFFPTDVMRGWKASFREGAIMQLHVRFMAARDTAMEGENVDTTNALVRITENAIQRWLEDHIKELEEAKPSQSKSEQTWNEDGERAGRAFGATVPLNKTVSEGTARPQIGGE